MDAYFKRNIIYYSFPRFWCICIKSQVIVNTMDRGGVSYNRNIENNNNAIAFRFLSIKMFCIVCIFFAAIERITCREYWMIIFFRFYYYSNFIWFARNLRWHKSPFTWKQKPLTHTALEQWQREQILFFTFEPSFDARTLFESLWKKFLFCELCWERKSHHQLTIIIQYTRRNTRKNWILVYFQ